jgi:hypothetical protein
MADLPEVAGIRSAEDLARTADYIAHTQYRSGAIPWFPGGRIDPWDHIECAMALDVFGRHEAAGRAYEWLASQQLADGSWPTRLPPGPAAPLREAHHAAYLAVGVWHHLLVTGDERRARTLWPSVRSGLDFALGLRSPRGEVLWARDAQGAAGDHALLTGSASIHHALRCGTALAERLEDPQFEWEMAAAQLGHIIAEHEDAFADRSRFSMDWYYPIIGGAVAGSDALRRLSERWETFVLPELGCHCVSDQPWVTGAETCELVLALAAAGEHARGLELFSAMQHLRDPDDGAYWTGYQYAQDVLWPVERSTWTAAAVILAADALSGATPGATVFTEPPPTSAPVDLTVCGCAEAKPRAAESA